MGLTIVDAGVVVAVLDPADPHHAAATDAVRGARDAGSEMVLPASAFAECLVWPLRAGDAAAQTAEAFIDALPLRVMPADRAIGRRAAALWARHGPALRLPDALVVATAIETGAEVILTTVARWPTLEVPVQVVSPDAPEPPA